MSRIPPSTDHRPAPSLPSFPTSQSPLIGREREVSQSVALLQRPDVRLVTLTGPGGIGKTRLSIAIAARIGHGFAHGARFISLAALPHASLVAGTIAREFKLAEATDVDPLGTVTATLHNTELLLVLDNFEHVISAAPILNELLGSCPGIKVLVTSRAPLRITGEHVFPVPPLELPDRIDTGSLSRITSSPAVQLFVDRARAVDPSFELNGDNAWIIGSICQHVDGLPLAIELAAAQCGVLPPAALLARIEAGMSLPFPGPRDAPDRLRTMREAISWSYELLTVEEQRLFRCAGVFVGGFGLAAADAVCHTPVEPHPADTSEVHPAHGPGFPPRPNSPDTLDGLAALLDSSLVQQAAWEGEPRFSLLETIRGFAREQLVEQEEYDAVHQAHAEWFLALAEESRWAWLLPGGEQQLRRLEIEHPNLLAALEWLHQHGDHDRLLRMTTVLSGFWYAHTHYREGSMWLQEALASATGASDIARAQANVSLGMLLNLQGHMSEAKGLLDAGLTALKDAGDDVTLALVFVSLGALANFRGDYEEAERLLHDALSLKDRIPDPALATSIQGRALSNLGVAAQGRGDLDLARVHYEHALRLYREHGYILGVIRSLCDRGELASDQGDFAGSLADFQECLSLVGARGDLRVVVDALEGAALAAAAWHHPEQAAKLLGAAAAIGEQIGTSATIEADRLARERAMAAVESMLSEQEIRSAWVIGHNLSLAEAITEVRAMSPPGAAGEDINHSTVRLSAREEEVLRMLVEGYSDRAIADALFLSVRTVEAHVTRIRIKLGVRSRTAAVTAAIISGLVDPNPSAEE